MAMDGQTLSSMGIHDLRVATIDINGVKLSGLEASATLDLGSVADQAEVAAEVTVTGAALGDFAMVSMGVDVADLLVSASVTAANTVTVTFGNLTTGAIDLASTTIRVLVLTRE